MCQWRCSQLLPPPNLRLQVQCAMRERHLEFTVGQDKKQQELLDPGVQYFSVQPTGFAGMLVKTLGAPNSPCALTPLIPKELVPAACVLPPCGWPGVSA